MLLSRFTWRVGSGSVFFVSRHFAMSILDDIVEVTAIIQGMGKTRVLGDVNAAWAIAVQAVDVIERFSEAAVRGDYSAAFGLFSPEFRARTTLDRFVALVGEGEKFARGPFVDFKVDKIFWIFADEASRNRSNKVGQWPKATPKKNKRCCAGAFWFSNKDTQVGWNLEFWVTEESDGYKITKFAFEDL
jgi:hypothetical protein